MKNFFLNSVAFIILLFISSNFVIASEKDGIINDFISNLVQGNAKYSAELFDNSLVPPNFSNQLSMIWKQLTDKYGKYKSISAYSDSSTADQYVGFIKNIFFEKDSIGLQFTFNSDNKIAGFFIVQPILLNYKDADYVVTSLFNEIDIYLTNDSLIKGKITIPKNTSNKKIPCVILVHGSGPSDFDETIGGRKIFRDIAYGLSSNGVACLRYNKRTLVDKNIDLKTFTLDMETTFDAVQAVEFVSKNYSDVINKIYVLGHSLGGYAIPRIAKLATKANGFISLAGNARPLEVLVKEQMNYLLNEYKNTLSDEEITQFTDEIAKCNKVINNDYNENTPSDSLPLNMPINYLIDLRNYNPMETLKDEKRPILFLQGSRDYQVTNTDFALWQEGLKKHKNCTFIMLNGLNHLLQFGTEKSMPAEYSQNINVAPTVIENITNWLKKQK
jgi:fermentation-respiration switch protein FrsA (DUF1100 family)